MFAFRFRPAAGPPPCHDKDDRAGAQRHKRLKQALADIVDAEMSYARRKHRLAARRHSQVDGAIKKAVREIKDAISAGIDEPVDPLDDDPPTTAK